MRFFLAILLMLSGVIQAQDEPRAVLRTQLDPAGPVLVGEPIRLKVDVLVTTWLTRAPVFPNIDIEGALVILPDERASNLSERIDGQSWFGISRSYLIYPQEAREFQIPPAEITVSYGQADEPVDLPIEQLTFRARIPAEARGLGYFIATSELDLSQEFDRKLTDLKVGESVQRIIKMSADKTFAMFLPPVEFELIEGLSVYPDPPRISDRSDDRAGFQGGDRIESATYVIQEEGDYELPSFNVFWWDLAASRIQEATIPAVQFSAAPNPDYVPEIPLPEIQEEVILEQGGTWYDWLKKWAIVLLILIAAIPFVFRSLIYLAKRINQLQIERQQRYQESEAAAFDRVKTAARKGKTAILVRYLYQWIDRILPGEEIGRLADLAKEDHRWNDQTQGLIADTYSKDASNQKWQDRAWISNLGKVRKKIKENSPTRKQSEIRLPDLNP